jgi:hypothetical protein
MVPVRVRQRRGNDSSIVPRRGRAGQRCTVRTRQSRNVRAGPVSCPDHDDVVLLTSVTTGSPSMHCTALCGRRPCERHCAPWVSEARASYQVGRALRRCAVWRQAGNVGDVVGRTLAHLHGCTASTAHPRAHAPGGTRRPLAATHRSHMLSSRHPRGAGSVPDVGPVRFSPMLRPTEKPRPRARKPPRRWAGVGAARCTESRQRRQA